MSTEKRPKSFKTLQEKMNPEALEASQAQARNYLDEIERAEASGNTCPASK